MESLTSQVTELTSSEALVRVRENYDSALSEARLQRQQQVEALEEELRATREVEWEKVGVAIG